MSFMNYVYEVCLKLHVPDLQYQILQNFSIIKSSLHHSKNKKPGHFNTLIEHTLLSVLEDRDIVGYIEGCHALLEEENKESKTDTLGSSLCADTNLDSPH